MVLSASPLLPGRSPGNSSRRARRCPVSLPSVLFWDGGAVRPLVDADSGTDLAVRAACFPLRP
jgi:hypothetical protein